MEPSENQRFPGLEEKARMMQILQEILGDLRREADEILDQGLHEIRRALPIDSPAAELAASVFDLRRLFRYETDRGCALAGGEFLNVSIRELLEASLVNDTRMLSQMFRPSGPLGSFDSRIELAFLLGLIGSDTRRELALFRKIRNEFAHSVTELSFDTDSIANRCRELSFGLWGPLGANRSNRGRFTGALMAVLSIIHGATLNAKRPASTPDVDDPEQFTRAILEFAKARGFAEE